LSLLPSVQASILAGIDNGCALGGGTGAYKALGGSRAYGALGGGGTCGAREGTFGRCLANEDGAWGFGDIVSMPSRKTHCTRCNILINLSLGISSIPSSIRD